MLDGGVIGSAWADVPKKISGVSARRTNLIALDFKGGSFPGEGLIRGFPIPRSRRHHARVPCSRQVEMRATGFRAPPRHPDPHYLHPRNGMDDSASDIFLSIMKES